MLYSCEETVWYHGFNAGLTSGRTRSEFPVSELRNLWPVLHSQPNLPHRAIARIYGIEENNVTQFRSPVEEKVGYKLIKGLFPGHLLQSQTQRYMCLWLSARASIPVVLTL